MGGRGAELKKGGEDEEVRETEQEGKGLASQPYFKGNTKPAVTKYSGIAFTELSPCSSGYFIFRC